MAQVGLHALVGLVVGERLLNGYVRNQTGRRALLFGFVLGNIIPDLDFLAVVSMYPIDPAQAMDLHRGFSHSLLAAAALAFGFFVAAVWMSDPYIGYLGSGLSLGVAGHFLLDMFIWFSPVDIFWPLSVFGMIPPVNLWWWWSTPPLLARLLGAAEFAAFALYYDHLARLATAFDTDTDMTPVVQRMATMCWLAWALVTALAVDLPDTEFSIYLYIPMGIVFMPSCLYLTWRMQTTIEHLDGPALPGVDLYE